MIKKTNNVTAFILAVVLCASLVGCAKKKDTNDDVQEPVATPTIEEEKSDDAPQMSLDGEVITSGGPSRTESGELVLTKINPAEPNNCSVNGYKEVKVGDGSTKYQMVKEVTEGYNLTPYKDSQGKGLVLSTGHTVYVRYQDPEAGMPEKSDLEQTEDSGADSETVSVTIGEEYTESQSGYIDENGNFVLETAEKTNTSDAVSALLGDEYNKDDGYGGLQKCIVSGVEVFDIDNITNELVSPYDEFQLRRENTSERIYVYNTKDEYNQAIENRENGQAILRGEKDPPEKCVILNGSLVPDLKFSINSEGRLCVSLRALAEIYDRSTTFDEVSELLSIPLCYDKYQLIPTRNALTYASEYFEIPHDRKTFKYQSRYSSNMWSDTFTLAQDADFVMPVEDISRIMGWEFWYNDNILKVVTDELDDMDPMNFVLEEVETTKTEISLDDLVDESDSETEGTGENG